jgi:hypothetical protein
MLSVTLIDIANACPIRYFVFNDIAALMQTAGNGFHHSKPKLEGKSPSISGSLECA